MTIESVPHPFSCSVEKYHFLHTLLKQTVCLAWISYSTRIYCNTLHVRAIPFEMLVGGVWCQFFRPPRSYFSIFSVVPCSEVPSGGPRPPYSDIGTILRSRCTIFKNAHQTISPPTFQMESPSKICSLQLADSQNTRTGSEKLSILAH